MKNSYIWKKLIWTKLIKLNKQLAKDLHSTTPNGKHCRPFSTHHKKKFWILVHNSTSNITHLIRNRENKINLQINKIK